ncbi:diphosphomevalonate decarboxylase [Nocardia tenerifensis]|uniref:diphosphomevalonate decarboxylase n=1 Tax=Nocardia tenerifensis TaxID=228006 RepID=A0A318JYC0_9NOCA|nr:diphosphomevalonate decarboxylase [Nocardia tenerifensis]PXX61769.1 diphosphomevalonate decarboxylase [Nocardia tenerifensis]
MNRTFGEFSAVAVAHPNIALLKYWGKRDREFVLPVTGSISMTLDIFPTTTRVTLVPGTSADRVTLNGRPADDETFARVSTFLDLVRDRTDRTDRAMVDSANTAPTGAGLASSSSGFAALAAAAAAAYNLKLNARDLSRLARRGSGSACRSVFDGFVEWHAGIGSGRHGDNSSFAEPIETPRWNPALAIALVDTGPKAIPSRTAMQATIQSSPLYLAWAFSTLHDLPAMRAAIRDGDLTTVGAIAESNALGMHATMLAARPSICYLSPPTISILHRVTELRKGGVAAYATIDAGPNVAVLCDVSAASQVLKELGDIDGVLATHLARPGHGVRVYDGNVA